MSTDDPGPREGPAAPDASVPTDAPGGTDAPAETEAPAVPPRLVVVRGDATAEEVAALVATLTALTGAPAAEGRTTPARHTGWSSRERAVGVGPRPGPATWRTSALPR